MGDVFVDGCVCELVDYAIRWPDEEIIGEWEITIKCEDELLRYLVQTRGQYTTFEVKFHGYEGRAYICSIVMGNEVALRGTGPLRSGGVVL